MESPQKPAAAVVRTRRALETLQLLQSGQTWTAIELAERFHCSSRTIFRDVQLLRECQIPVESPPGERRGFRLSHDFFWKPVRPSMEELAALVIAARLSQGALPPELSERVETALTKVLSAAKPAVRERLGELSVRIDAPHCTAQPPLPEAAFLSQLLGWIVEQTPLRVSWKLSGSAEPTSENLTAQQLTIAEGQWQLVGSVLGSGASVAIPLATVTAIEAAMDAKASEAAELKVETD
jgi:predicted DNA-binding transcriptional regulator YafY